ncbi:MAG TPA: hypothetical protein ENN84_10175, partial [Candidatus Marinimicrobia bacterium]|nr:hypothetical protein [Candidatus Neomarinimicrobiota bacterium]
MKIGSKHRHPVRHTILFMIFLLVGVIVWLGFQVQHWYPLPLWYINNHIFAESEWKIELASLRGNANNGLRAEFLKIQNSDSSIVFLADTASTKYGNIFSLLRRNISLIELHHPRII